MNNQDLYDAIVAGSAGGDLERWIVKAQSSEYDDVYDAVVAFATAVDAAIPIISGGASLSQINLLNSLTHGVISSRYLQNASSDVFADIAAAIAASFAQGSTRLTNQPALASSVLSVTSFGVNALNSPAVNTTLLNVALAAALAAGAQLYWPGVYTINGNLLNMHSVQHLGPGGVTRGTDTFRVDPVYGQTNRLYVDTAGSAVNDGITSALPVATPGAAGAILRNYGPMLNGSWIIILAAGTWNIHSQTFDTPSRDWVVVRGPAVGASPAVPTAILDGTAVGANRHGFVINGQGVQIWVQDIKFQNYNAGTQNSCGIAAGYAARVYANNVHCNNCDFAGILADQADILLVGGGIINACRSGVILNASKGTIGYGATSLATGPLIQNCTQSSVYWSRGAQGHIDYTTCKGNAITPTHLVFDASARAHVLGCDFQTATVAAISTDTSADYYDDVVFTNNYNDGTGLANAKRYNWYAFSGEQQRQLQVSRAPYLWYEDDTVRTVTSVAKAAFSGGALKTIPAWMFSQKTKIIFVVDGETPASTCSIGIDFNSAGPTVVAMDLSASTGAAAAAGFKYTCEVMLSSMTTERSYAQFACSNLGTRIQNTGNAADMRVDQSPTLMGLSAAGTITVRRVQMWILPG